MIFPCHLYKVPGPHMRFGVMYRYIGCEDQEAYDRLTSEGWYPSIEDAKAKQSANDDDSPPTRDELERKATELNIKFDRRTGDKLLSRKIDEALG